MERTKGKHLAAIIDRRNKLANRLFIKQPTTLRLRTAEDKTRQCKRKAQFHQIPTGNGSNISYLGSLLLVQFDGHQSRRTFLTNTAAPAVPEEIDTA